MYGFFDVNIFNRYWHLDWDMQYRIDIKSGNKLSIIGFGCMRFPRNFTQIDTNQSEQLIIKAVQDGINYFDTAYLYGGSEDTLGQILAKNDLRNKIFLATKLPIVKCGSYDDFEDVSYTVGLVSGYLQYQTSTGGMDSRKNYAANKCRECGICEKKCPQHIPIIKSLKNVTKRMESFCLRTVFKIFLKLRG